MEYTYVFNLTIAQFKSIKKAVKVLVRAGIDYDSAVKIVMSAHDAKVSRQSRYIA